MKARTIFGCIARQLAVDLPAEKVQNFEPNTTDIQAISRFLNAVLAPTRRYFIILDGLDECEESELRDLLGALKCLLSPPQLRVKVFLTTRTNVKDWISQELQPYQHLALNASQYQERIALDLEKVINTALQERLEKGKLHVGDPTLILKIEDALNSRAQGM